MSVTVHLQAMSQSNSLECFVHLPYNTELAPNDFHFLGPLMKHFEGKHFQHDVEVKAKVHWWVQMLSPDFFSARINQLMHC
jgi:hypothetical protein